jgi:DNA-binding Lrp family transcriptional regulator
LKAYVLIQTEGAEPISEAIRSLPGVISADDLRGPYDAIAMADSVSAERPIERIIDDIRSVPGVIRALTAPLTRRAGARQSSLPATRGDEAA